jgi:hypothetical protein
VGIQYAAVSPSRRQVVPAFLRERSVENAFVETFPTNE